MLALPAAAQDSLDLQAFHERAQNKSEHGVTVTAAVPSASETLELFGLPLYKRGIQPVWIEVRNDRSSAVAFLSVGLDPRYFTPIESASLGSGGFPKADWLTRRSLLDRKMDMNVEPGESRSGFVFSQLDEGTKAFNIDIDAGNSDVIRFTFFIPVPGLRLDHHDVDWDTLYAPEEIRDVDKDELIRFLEEFHCCTTDEDAQENGDPLNLVVMGDPDAVYYAFIRAGWDETEVVSAKTLLKMGASLVSGGEYRYSPVSGLYVLGRTQDVALQKARDNIHERNHLRLWMTPLRFEGVPVWIGQISRDIGIRLSKKTITTHKVDPDVDETREYLVENLAYAQSLAKLAYVGGVGAASIDDPRANLTGDPYFTDGHRVILWLSSKPVDLSEIEVLRWGTPPVR